MKATLFKILMGGLSILIRSIFVYWLWNKLVPDIFLTACEIHYGHAVAIVLLFHFISDKWAWKNKE